MGRRVKTLVQLLGLLVLICLFALQAGWFEEKRDQVQTSKVLKPIPQSSLNKPDQPINTESVVHPSTVPVSISSNEEAPKPRKKANSKPVLIDYDKSSSDFYDLLPDLKRPVVPLNKLSYSEDDTISTDKPICPTWTAYDVNTQAAKDFSDNCRDVPVAPSYESMFSVNLCESKTHCGQGYFLIERKDLYECYEEFNQLLSHNEQLDAYLKKNIGPDAFHMIFSGPERAAPTMWHQLSPCIYKLPYRLTNSGTYTLNLIHSHTNFSAINEVANKYPSPLVTPILPTNFTLSICPTCPVFTPKSVTSLDLPLCPATSQPKAST
ncbi:hypothetical protein BCR33DRAFT_847081 [Rhizoclosmatium globosum]|uniref:Uncharacterized protein n=1 Tax=Rhizoclosmatium globosum TaxID=329046 RepID=A0A1Y2CS54_9FUNG|nr:hypothetical protein BCR33DRAFT_847081 [Rhizoclosmatium globosum]|eukprot:ORY49803.1 hypothetical protein BCR33DRAFT_847081 [Rhizoclosmatium globosum]